MVLKFGILFFLFPAVVSGNGPNGVLKHKAEFIEAGIAKIFGALQMEGWTYRNSKTKTLFSPQNKLKRENPAQQDDIIAFANKIQDERAIADLETFRGLLAEAYRLLFRYGSVVFQGLSADLYLTSLVQFPRYFSHSDTSYDDSVIDLLASFNGSYAEDFLVDVFGEKFDLTQLKGVFVPLPNDTEIPLRKKLLYDLSIAAWKTTEIPEYQSCTEFIMKTYSAYYVKMLIDYLSAEYVAAVDEIFRNDIELLMKTVKNQFAFGNVLSENMTEFLEQRVPNNTFYGIQAPALADSTFFTIFGQVTTEWPVQNVWINNLQPLVHAAYGKDTTYFWIPGVDDNAVHFANVQRTFVNIGNLKPPIFHPYYPPVLRWSAASSILSHEFGHDFGTDLKGLAPFDPAYEKIFDCLDDFYNGQCDPADPDTCADPKQNLEENFADNFGIQMSYLAYKQDTTINGANNRLQGNFLAKLTDDQLFFVNFAQSIASYSLWGEIPLFRDPHAPGSLRLWGPLAGFPAFANAFGCPTGSRFNQANGCKLYTDNIAPSYNLTDDL